MRAVLTSLGSMGDIQPFIALAHELKNAGHHPILAMAPNFRSLVQRQGLPFAPIGPELNNQELQRKETTAVAHGASEIELLVDSLSILKSILPQVFSDLREICYDSDALISGQLQMASRMVHELTGIPFVTIQTNHFGGQQQQEARSATANVINSFRSLYGLPSINDPIYTDGNSSQLALYAISRYFRPPNLDWPPHYHVTGFFFSPETIEERDPRLSEFIESGSAPVVISFSSMAHDNPNRVTQALIEAIQIAGCRGIIQRGWSGLARIPLPPDILAVDFVPHTILFRNANCVVHHAGAGTTAASILAGAPSVLIPHVGDQLLYAEIARDLGCAEFIIPFRELSGRRLGEAIAETIANKQYSRNVASMAEKLRCEQGVIVARQLIEQLIERLKAARDHRCKMEVYVSSNSSINNRRKQYQRARLLRRRSGKSSGIE
jgi:sterol 3beta-glucosyltransferase